MGQTAFFKGDGGAVFEMDLPLTGDMAKRAARGELRRVNPDGSRLEEPDEEAPASPVVDQAGEDEDLPPELAAFEAEPVKPVAKPRAKKADQ